MTACLLELGDGHSYEVVALELTAAESASLKRDHPALLFCFAERARPPLAVAIFGMEAPHLVALPFPYMREQLQVEMVTGITERRVLNAAYPVLIHLTGRMGNAHVTTEAMGWRPDWHASLRR